MELQGITIPGYRTNEYLLIVQPNESLEERIKHVRAEFDRQFSIEHKIPGRPNIGLVQFMQYEMYEARLRNKLKTVGLGYQPFKIELNGFGSYPSHSIFLQMVSRSGVQDLIKDIREQAGPLMRLNADNKPHFFKEPNINVGIRLKPWQYEKAWLEYSRKHFKGSFIADAMLLLKRREKGQPWQIVERYDFANLLINAPAQGLLF